MPAKPPSPSKNKRKKSTPSKPRLASKRTILSPKAYRIGRARTGLGLFAVDPIPKGTYIIEYFGPRIDSRKYELPNSRYLFDVNSRWSIDGSPRKNIARYINHSCRPNAEPEIIKGEIRIYAKKNIKPDDEITYNYGKEYFDEYLKPVGCKCAACVEKRKRARAAKRAKA